MKHLLAAPCKLLVDDFDGNVDGWVAAGGAAVIAPRPWNRFRPATGADGRFGPDAVAAEVLRLAGA